MLFCHVLQCTLCVSLWSSQATRRSSCSLTAELLKKAIKVFTGQDSDVAMLQRRVSPLPFLHQDRRQMALWVLPVTVPT